MQLTKLFYFLLIDVKEVLSPLDLRSQSNEFIELSAEEFESVPATTRGRVKLADVNMVSILFNPLYLVAYMYLLIRMHI